MSGVDELVVFLRAALDCDEQVALKAKAMRYDLPTDAPWERERIIVEQVGGNSSAIAVHRMAAIFAHPDRVLGEVEAKRRVLDEYTRACHMERVTHENDDPGKWEWLARSEALERVVQLLAQPYAGRPGWREEWAEPDRRAA